MSKKSAKIAGLLEGCRGQKVNANYLGYFECFNRGLFFEAHDVLEELWLADKQSPNHGFYKGLIQLAGAFVHLQKNRLKPSAALFTLARSNLEKYPSVHEHLDVKHLLGLIAKWLGRLESSKFAINPLSATPPPQLALLLTYEAIEPPMNDP
ncbi:MAG: DUF309 domain-containing protein [Verrucomicrobiales bacterium]|nr:DUF309 domain-containing protein [Verrucomicrobiales bacterium]